jgi:RND family efflux transporter MFP subunit
MKKHKKKIIWIIIILIIIVGGVFYLKGKKAKITYTTADVTKGELKRTVSVTGTVKSTNSVDLSFESSGEIKSLLVSVGDKVTKGQKIATIDTSTLQSQLAQAQADVKSQKETLDNMKKRDDVYNGDQRDAQRAVITSAEAAVDQINTQIRNAVMTSPMDGIVTKKNFEVGETAIAGSAVVTVSSAGDLEIDANIPESDIIKITLDQTALISPDAFPLDDTLTAKVFDIEPASTVIQDVVYYKIKMKFDNQDSRLKNGMSADVDISTADAKSVLMIPARAIKTENGNKFVDVLKADNTLDHRQITTGLEGDEGMVEVKSGLNEGEKVVTFQQ